MHSNTVRQNLTRMISNSHPFQKGKQGLLASPRSAEKAKEGAASARCGGTRSRGRELHAAASHVALGTIDTCELLRLEN